MEEPIHPRSSTSPVPSARSQIQKPARSSKFSQKLSSLKGIIRLPMRRSRDDAGTPGALFPPPSAASHNQAHTRNGSAPLPNGLPSHHQLRDSAGRPAATNDPYAQGGRNSWAMKPYMSQPMLSLTLGTVGGGGGEAEGRRSFEDQVVHGLGYEDESDQSSPSPTEHSPVSARRVTALDGAAPRPRIPQPQQRPPVPASALITPRPRTPASASARPSSPQSSPTQKHTKKGSAASTLVRVGGVGAGLAAIESRSGNGGGGNAGGGSTDVDGGRTTTTTPTTTANDDQAPAQGQGRTRHDPQLTSDSSSSSKPGPQPQPPQPRVPRPQTQPQSHLPRHTNFRSNPSSQSHSQSLFKTPAPVPPPSLARSSSLSSDGVTGPSRPPASADMNANTTVNAPSGAGFAGSKTPFQSRPPRPQRAPPPVPSLAFPSPELDSSQPTFSSAPMHSPSSSAIRTAGSQALESARHALSVSASTSAPSSSQVLTTSTPTTSSSTPALRVTASSPSPSSSSFHSSSSGSAMKTCIPSTSSSISTPTTTSPNATPKPAARGPSGVLAPSSHRRPTPSTPTTSTPSNKPQTALFPPIVPRRASSTSSSTFGSTSSTYTSTPTTPTPSTQATPPPRLTLPPPNHRFSFTGTGLGLFGPSSPGGSGARLSPSVILRPPPLPLMNLPVLTPTARAEASVLGSSSAGGIRRTASASAAGGGNRHSRLFLKNMPALPLQGTGRGVGAHEEVDEDEDEDDDDEEEDEEEEEHYEERGSSRLSTPTDGSGDTPRSSVDSVNESSDHSRSRSRSSYETARGSPTEPYFGDPARPPDKRFSRTPNLPHVDTTRLDLDMSFLERPPPSPAKGKARARDRGRRMATEDAGSTPVARSWGQAHGRKSGADHLYHAPQDMGRSMSERTPRTSTSSSSRKPVSPSPATTPRPGDYQLSFGVNQLQHPGPMPGMVSRLSEARLSSTLGGLSAHPSMYKRASRSLIDVHAAEKKERVEAMVLQEEEGAEEERKRRVRALRMSMRAVVKGTKLEDGKELDGPRDPAADPPHSADAVMEGAGELIDASSGALGVPDVEVGAMGRRQSKRISMAPAYDTLANPHPLRRRRSMPTFNATTAPPPYPDFHPHQFGGKILPREDEGTEKLPPYTNDIYLKAIMPRKLEFSKPGVQARDRKWRRVLCVLEGTAFRVYKPPAGASGVSAIGEWWENRVGVGDVAFGTANTTSAFHTAAAAGGSSTGAEALSADERADLERALAMSRKSAEGGDSGQFVLQADSPTSPHEIRVQPPPEQQHSHSHSQPQQSWPSHEHHHLGGIVLPAARSALNLAVQLLKPGVRHGRSNSDVAQNPPRPRSPRPSLNIPRSGRTTPTTASSTHSSSLRSPSPAFTTSTSLTTPSPSIRSSSRPATPAPSVSTMSSATSPSGSSSSSRSGFRVGGGAHARSLAARNASGAPSSYHSKDKGKEREKDKEAILDPDECDLMRAYTMQNAESGLGSDYVKRKHVIRVRLEGEQFLLQAQDVESVIAWIEGLQSATNIALDLDERPMPRGPIFPRRRRRRRVQPGAINTTTTNATTNPNDPTPVSATQLTAPLTMTAGR